MRLQNSASNDVEIQEFADWILKLGDGVLGEPNDGEDTIDIPDEFLIKNAQDPIASIVHSIYPNRINALSDGSVFHYRAILAPTNEIVCRVYEYVLSLIDGEEKVYLSSDSVSKTNSFVNNHTDAFSFEFLNTIRCSGLSNHEIRLKKGVPIMLLRNIDQSACLCNGTRLTVNRLGEHIIEAKILTSCKKGDIVLIPRMTLTPSDSAYLPLNLQRRKFPISLCFAMTINKSQGQSVSHVGIFLPRPVFSHGQLYVAVSHVTSKRRLKILICETTTQVILPKMLCSRRSFQTFKVIIVFSTS